MKNSKIEVDIENDAVILAMSLLQMITIIMIILLLVLLLLMVTSNESNNCISYNNNSIKIIKIIITIKMKSECTLK